MEETRVIKYKTSQELKKGLTRLQHRSLTYGYELAIFWARHNHPPLPLLVDSTSIENEKIIMVSSTSIDDQNEILIYMEGGLVEAGDEVKMASTIKGAMEGSPLKADKVLLPHRLILLP